VRSGERWYEKHTKELVVRAGRQGLLGKKIRSNSERKGSRIRAKRGRFRGQQDFATRTRR